MTATYPAPIQTEKQVSPSLTIEGIDEFVVLQYFETLNAGNFRATANLFSAEGQLHPPFESALIGPNAIVAYLEAEAEGMELMPRHGAIETNAQGETFIKVVGKVTTAWFSVNVAWLFALDRSKKITSATVKLLASPQELLGLRRMS